MLCALSLKKIHIRPTNRYSMSSASVSSINHDYLNLGKVCARWVSHQLTDAQKQFCIQFCRQSLKRFEKSRSRRVSDIITDDEVVLESSQIMNTNWYVNHWLPEVFKAVSERRSNIGVHNLIFHDDNTIFHRVWITHEF